MCCKYWNLTNTLSITGRLSMLMVVDCVVPFPLVIGNVKWKERTFSEGRNDVGNKMSSLD